MSNRKVIPVKFNHAAMADKATLEFDADLIAALNKASAEGVAPGIIIAILQGRLHLEVTRMCNAAVE